MMDVIEKYKTKDSFSPDIQVKVNRKEQTEEIRIQRDILGKLIRSFFNANSCIEVENPGCVKWSETCFPVNMDDVFISSVIRTWKMMRMTIVLITKISGNAATANFK